MVSNMPLIYDKSINYSRVVQKSQFMVFDMTIFNSIFLFLKLSYLFCRIFSYKILTLKYILTGREYSYFNRIVI